MRCLTTPENLNGQNDKPELARRRSRATVAFCNTCALPPSRPTLRPMDPVTAFAVFFLPVAVVLVMAMPLRAAIRRAEAERKRADSAEAITNLMAILAAKSAAALEDLRASLSRSEGDPYRSGPPKDLDVTTGKLTALDALAAYQRWVSVARRLHLDVPLSVSERLFFSRIARLHSGFDSATVGGDGEIH